VRAATGSGMAQRVQAKTFHGKFFSQTKHNGLRPHRALRHNTHTEGISASKNCIVDMEILFH
jgi:hypothetical protein